MLLSTALALAFSAPNSMQEDATSGWREPAPEVVDLLDAPPTPRASVAPGGGHLLWIERPAMPALADVMSPWVGLAGLRIDTGLGARHRTSFDSGFLLRDLRDPEAQDRRVALPEGARLASTSWSHTGHHFAFTLAVETGYELWVCDAAQAQAQRVAGPLVGVFGSGFTWLPDGKSLLVALVPEGRGEAPQRERVPVGPILQETAGAKAPARTYQDLLRDAHDEALFDHYLSLIHI